MVEISEDSFGYTYSPDVVNTRIADALLWKLASTAATAIE
jgi:hypothetical protein